ncbi:MAG TPA: hypothetical protein VFY23_05450 [Candidatus Limnocylindrales bacterium]|jgi:hypothetical protein|nr:hypothetical protein [Candidatus Limnocylindrales bacterium]
MTKHSKHERAKRATESEQMVAIERAWTAAIPASVAADFAREVAVAQTRVYERQPDMAPGTAPRPPRPGREPKPAKEETRPRRY